MIALYARVGRYGGPAELGMLTPRTTGMDLGDVLVASHGIGRMVDFQRKWPLAMIRLRTAVGL